MAVVLLLKNPNLYNLILTKTLCGEYHHLYLTSEIWHLSLLTLALILGNWQSKIQTRSNLLQSQDFYTIPNCQITFKLYIRVPGRGEGEKTKFLLGHYFINLKMTTMIKLFGESHWSWHRPEIQWLTLHQGNSFLLLAGAFTSWGKWNSILLSIPKALKGRASPARGTYDL